MDGGDGHSTEGQAHDGATGTRPAKGDVRIGPPMNTKVQFI